MRSLVAFVRAVVDVARRQNVSFMAGSLSYYAFVALVPLGALVMVALALAGLESFAEHVVSLTGSPLSPQVETLLRRNVVDTTVSGAVGASVVVIVTALWGSIRLFRGLKTAFSTIYGTSGESSVLHRLGDVCVVLLTIPAALVAVGVATLVLSFVAVTTLHIHVAAPLLLAGGLTVVFLPLYYVFPDTEVSVREVMPGVTVAAVGWVVLQQLFQVYVHLVGTSVGGALGAVILSLTWLYFASVVLLLGCVVNAVYGGYHDRHVKHQLTRRGRTTRADGGGDGETVRDGETSPLRAPEDER